MPDPTAPPCPKCVGGIETLHGYSRHCTRCGDGHCTVCGHSLSDDGAAPHVYPPWFAESRMDFDLRHEVKTS